ncbi:type II secretory pathway pseudopilin PulG [Desulfobaculum xiamenense]|uniref:Type II secretory pathway pseudopilin PulG n=1 Tax=Desulfobaculum xiamenense TaxID=995050 RepID=A0A846QR59_9BACT|nr:hypothetical protein [Desulfobaculum xiamenense]NJB67875.1 type II secretory pathway pseudopilin PulG [Desulfobaculum xiamenense]
MDHPPWRNAFSLIEMAIIVVIIGLIVSTTLPRILSQIGTDKVADSRDLVRQARDEIIGEMLASPSFALPTPGTGNVVPAVIATQKDAWGQPLYYFVADVSGGSKLTNSGICANNATLLTVTEPSGASVADVAFAVASFGPNTQRDFNALPGSGTATLPVQPLGDTSTEDATRQFDDLFEYVKLTYLHGKVNCDDAEHTGPGGSDVSFEQDMGAFPLSAPGDGYVTRSAGRTPFDLNVDGDGFTITRTGSDDIACLWYMGNATEANCTDGECLFGSGFRAYFLWNMGEAGGGHTFAFCGVNSTNNLNDDPARLCGGSAGDDLGYASQRGGTDGIDQPKVGVEFDANYHSGTSDPAYSGANQAGNHVAILYWRNNANRNDDATHTARTGAGTGNPDDTVGPRNGTDGVYDEGVPYWLELTAPAFQEIPFRMEVDWNATTQDIDIRVWHNCTNADCADLTDDLENFGSYVPATDAPQITNSTNLGIGANQLYRFRFGWTYSSQYSTYNASISDFRIRFKP